jgi:catechol 2,3-dioxygenase-like lactoylglutathione lyase family enzyme
MNLDHASIVTRDLDGTLRFFQEVAGLTEGPRPPFDVAGHWLYRGGRPLVHIVLATLPAQDGLCAPRIDHVAFRVDSRDEWELLIERLRATATHYSVAEVPQTQQRQLFVRLSPNVAVEFVAPLHFTDCQHGESDARSASSSLSEI